MPEDIFVIVDFDRTLADSDKLLEVFVQVANEYTTIPREQLEQAAADVVRRGDSFDTAGYVRDHLLAENRLDDWEKLEQWYIREAKSLDMLMPQAQEFLEYLDAHSYRYGILTYGNPLWQRLKLSASRLQHIPHIVMTHKQKGRLIATWRVDDGFELPTEFGGGKVSSVVLIDDKAVSFDEFPGSPSRGYWVADQQALMPSQQGSVPGNVTSVRDLGILRDEFTGGE